MKHLLWVAAPAALAVVAGGKQVGLRQGSNVVIIKPSSEAATCPSSHPFAYHTNNAYCCKTNKEKVDVPLGAACDGSKINARGVASMCCYGDDHATCPSPPCSNSEVAPEPALHEHLKHMKHMEMPEVKHADSLSLYTDGWLDWFLVIYWGVLIALIGCVEIYARLNDGVPRSPRQIQSDNSFRKSHKSSLHHYASQPDMSEHTPASEMTAPLSPGSGEGHQPVQRGMTLSNLLLGDEADEKEIELGPNLWTLSIVTALGKATDRSQKRLSPYLVWISGLFMGMLQLFTLFLIVYDIDPAAVPYTVTPSAPWKTSPLTVNCMKFVMVFFLGMSVVAEAGDSYDNLVIGMGVNRDKLLVGRWMVLFSPCFHYVITLSVIMAGVSVILSCQAVPDILYNSMAILFITQVDELFWSFMEKTFEIQAVWTVKIKESRASEAKLVQKCLIMFPMFMAFSLLGRAWYRDTMPALVVRMLANNGA